MNLGKAHNIYFIGIGGIGMSALALFLKKNGKNIAGYDRVSSLITTDLEEAGISIHYDDAVDDIPPSYKSQENTLVVYTPAIPTNHVEMNYFLDEGFVLMKRSELLGEITKSSFCLAVAGTHGKTTTSAILAHIMKEGGTNATSFLGGISENYQSNLVLGDAKTTVVEADEFDRSFLRLRPNIACITSMDADHLDIYGSYKELETSFTDFAELVTDRLIVHKSLPIHGITYGFEQGSDYEVKNIRIEEGSYVFDVEGPTDLLKNLKIDLPGRHNVLNTVAALAMADSFGIPKEVIAKALLTFKGVKRRFSYKIKKSNLVLIDDYAHHPTEIKAVYSAVKEIYPTKSVLGVFQPHLYSRTKDFIEDFVEVLSLFDELILLDIYPAREQPIQGVTSTWLLEKMRGGNRSLSSKQKLIENIGNSNAEIIVVMGAGDIGEMVEEIKNSLSIEN